MDDSLNKYNNTSVNETINIFERNLCKNFYEIDLEDVDTKKELKRCITTDVDLLIKVGPLNPSNPEYDNELICKETKGGKCGSYFCLCCEDEETENWFTGICSYCDEEIEHFKLARRIPLHYGGFKGCFCSTECIHIVLSENTYAIEHKLAEIMEEFYLLINIKEYENSFFMPEEEPDEAEEDFIPEEETYEDEEDFIPEEYHEDIKIYKEEIKEELLQENVLTDMYGNPIIHKPA